MRVWGCYTCLRLLSFRIITALLCEKMVESLFSCRHFRVLRSNAYEVLVVRVDRCTVRSMERTFRCCWSCIGRHFISDSFLYLQMFWRCRILPAILSSFYQGVHGAPSVLVLGEKHKTDARCVWRLLYKGRTGHLLRISKWLVPGKRRDLKGLLVTEILPQVDVVY